jgi:uncharacterized protein (DUF362 family)
MKNPVALCRVERGDIPSAVARVLELSGCSARLERGSRVLIKPNLVTDKPDYIALGANTSVEVLEALLALLRDHGCRTALVESETGTPAKGRKLHLSWARMGLPALAAKYDAQLLNLTDLPRVPVRFEGSRIPEIEVSAEVEECDLLIDIPKIKTHKYAVLTCSMKNLYGLLPEPRRVIYHRWLSEIIAHLTARYAAKSISLVDGLIGMEGNGPLYGTAVELNLLLAGQSLWQVDRAVCELIGVDPRTVRYLVIGSELGLGKIEDLPEVVGESLADCQRPFRPVEFNLYRLFEKKLMESPLVNVVTSHWFQAHISRHIGGLTQRLRGGGYSWYLDE